MSTTSNVRRVTATAARAFTGRWRRLATLGTAGACAATSFAVIGSSGVAMADVCGTHANGVTSWSTTIVTATWNPLRSVWVKQPPGCHDYNIVHVNATGNYAGYLLHSDGRWLECAAGYILIPGGVTSDWVECSNVATGTRMTTDTSQFPGGIGYRVNY